MTKRYLRMLNNAGAWTKQHFPEYFQLWCPIDVRTPVDGDAVVKAICDDFSDGVVDDTRHLVGHCFVAVREASYALFELGIRHAVTIGSVKVDRRPFYRFSKEVLIKELREGYIPNTAANGHAWLTLSDGTILDLTIISSILNKRGLAPAELADAIYHSSKSSPFDIHHEPLMLGLGYHFSVVCAPFTDRYASMYEQWFNELFAFEARVGGRREVWRVNSAWQFDKMVRPDRSTDEGGSPATAAQQDNED